MNAFTSRSNRMLSFYVYHFLLHAVHVHSDQMLRVWHVQYLQAQVGDRIQNKHAVQDCRQQCPKSNLKISPYKKPSRRWMKWMQQYLSGFCGRHVYTVIYILYCHFLSIYSTWPDWFVWRASDYFYTVYSFINSPE